MSYDLGALWVGLGMWKKIAETALLQKRERVRQRENIFSCDIVGGRVRRINCSKSIWTPPVCWLTGWANKEYLIRQLIS